LTPLSTDTVRWGILGPGSIAISFANGLTSVSGATLQAVGSRTQEKADKFGAEHNAPNRHGSYEALAADPEVDAIYISTPHPQHKDAALLCLRHGKAVLVEKPFAVNAAEAEEMIAEARAQDVFLMEAMWSRFFPAMDHLKKILADGIIGQPRMLLADFGFRTGVNPEGRLFAPAMAGGGLLDVGIYPLSLASFLFGEATQAVGVADMGETGVDEQAALSLLYKNGEVAALTCGTRTNTPHGATILGTEGSIQLAEPFWKPSTMTIKAGDKTEEVTIPFTGQGMNYEAEEVGNCLRAGKTESDKLPLSETLSLMKTMDSLRSQWGLKYPME